MISNEKQQLTLPEEYEDSDNEETSDENEITAIISEQNYLHYPTSNTNKELNNNSNNSKKSQRSLMPKKER